MIFYCNIFTKKYCEYLNKKLVPYAFSVQKKRQNPYAKDQEEKQPKEEWFAISKSLFRLLGILTKVH